MRSSFSCTLTFPSVITSISATLRNWSLLKYHISGRIVFQIHRIMRTPLTALIVLVWSAETDHRHRLHLPSLSFLVTYSFSSLTRRVWKRNCESLRFKAVFFTKDRKKNRFLECCCDDGTAKKFHLNIHFICISFFFSSSENKKLRASFLLATKTFSSLNLSIKKKSEALRHKNNFVSLLPDGF